jgi:hypothetical protein
MLVSALRRFAGILLSALLLVAAQSRKPAKEAGPPLQLERTIPLGNIEGRLGHPVIDLQKSRLFIPAGAAGTVEVVDLNAGRVVKSIQGLSRPQSAAWYREFGRLYVTTRQDASLSIFDDQLNLIRKVALSATPDDVRVVRGGKQVLVSAGNSILVLDVNGQNQGIIRFDSPPSAFLVAPGGQRLWVNLPINRTIAIADLVSRIALRSYAATAQSYALNADKKALNISVASGMNNGLALDDAGRHVFIISRRPPKLVVMDSDSGNIRDSRETVTDPEDIWYDPASRRIFITGTDPVIDVVNHTEADRYEPMARIPSAPGARTSLLVPEQNRFYVVAPKDGNKPAAVLVYSTR